MVGGGNLSFRVQPHPRYGWLIATLQVGTPGENLFLEMAISTLTPLSGVSISARNALLATGYLRTQPDRAERYLLRQLSIEGQDVADLEVGLSRAAHRAGVAGFLGLDFFLRFLDVHVHVPTLQVTLVAL